MLHHRLLLYLDEVARSGSIRAAARKLNVASSAINRQILALEADLSTPIFERLPRRLRLTAVGELLIDHVRETLRGEARLQLRVADLIGLRWGRVSVATIGTVAAEILPAVVASFREVYPKCTIEVHVFGDVVAQIQSDEADVGIGFDLPTPPGVQVMFDLPVTIGAVMPPDHPLASRSMLTLAACAAYPLIMPSAAMSTRPAIDRAFKGFGDTVNATIISNSAELMKEAVRLGQGIAFLTALNVAEERERGQLAFVPLSDSRMSPLHLRGLVKEGRKSNLMVQPFIRECELQTGRMLAGMEAFPTGSHGH